MSVPEFDQLVEYVTEGPVIHPVTLAQHSLEVVETVEAITAGYIHAKALARALCADPELAMVFCEWTPAGGMASLSGVVASKVLKGWTAKSVAVAYIVAPSAAVDAINASRTTAVAFIRVSLDGGGTPLPPRDPFTAAQVGYLSTWINAHGITNAEFAALFNVTAAQLSAWLQSHPRWQFAAQLNERFS
jgi:hypothetical protein